MDLPLTIPVLSWSPEVELEVARMAKVSGFKWQERENKQMQISIGPFLYEVPASALYKRLLSELVELASVRIGIGTKEHHFYVLARLTEPVLRRAVADGLKERAQVN